jgi:hypothetical protein
VDPVWTPPPTIQIKKKTGATAAVKRRAVEPVNKVKILPVYTDAYTDKRFRHLSRKQHAGIWLLAILTHISPGFHQSLHQIKGQYLTTYHDVFRIFPFNTHQLPVRRDMNK